MKCSVYIATSVDGFIAGEGGDIEWLHRPEFDDAMSLGLRYDTFISTVDALVMGLSFRVRERWFIQMMS